MSKCKTCGAEEGFTIIYPVKGYSVSNYNSDGEFDDEDNDNCYDGVETQEPLKKAECQLCHGYYGRTEDLI